jgi:hypothetical protein
VAGFDQGCQIFLGPKYQNGGKYTKLPQNIPSGLNGRKIDQMVIKYTKIFPSKIYPNWDFWFENKPSGNPGFDPAVLRFKLLRNLYD